MSTSNRLGKDIRNYIIAAVSCIVFTTIYYQFSHGVHSPFMTFMFAIPLIGGALPAAVMKMAKMREPSRKAVRTWALAIAALSVASCLKGVFAIAGTDSPLLVAYIVFACILAALAFIFFVKDRAGGRIRGAGESPSGERW